MLLSISIIIRIFGARIRLAIVSLFCVFWQIMVKLVTRFLYIIFYMIFASMLFCVSHMSSVVLVAIDLSSRALFFVRSLLLFFREKFHHNLFMLTVYRNIITTNWLSSLFFIRIFLCLGADFLARKIAGTGLNFFGCDGQF